MNKKEKFEYILTYYKLPIFTEDRKEKEGEKKGNQVILLAKYNTWHVAKAQETAVRIALPVYAKGSHKPTSKRAADQLIVGCNTRDVRVSRHFES